MSTEMQRNVLVGYFWFGIALMVVLLGRVVIRAFRHVSVAEVRDAMAKKKRIKVDPTVNAELQRDSKIYRRVMMWWMLSFLALSLIVLRYGR